VTDAEGRCVVVEGDGVVGEFPYLQPHHQFSYNSYHTTAGRAVAKGAYLAVTEDGEAVMALIPPFDLIPPGD
jgi:ApaG protein